MSETLYNRGVGIINDALFENCAKCGVNRTVSLRITLTFGTLVIAGFFTNPTVFLTLFKNPLTFSGHVPTESLRTQDSENVYERWVQQIFDPVLPARSWEMPVKCELPAKIGRCSKKPPGRNFDFRAKSS